MSPAEAFGQRLVQAMRAKGVKNPEVAEALGVHEVTVSKWRTGKQPIEPARIGALAGFLGVSVPWLRFGENPVVEGHAPTVAIAPRHARNLPLAIREYLAETRLRLVKGGASDDEVEEAMTLLHSPEIFSYFSGGKLNEYNETDALNGMRSIVEDAVIPRLRKMGRKIT